MPLKSGKGSFGANVSELMHAYERKGSIGSSHPSNKTAALKQALAIAYDKTREKRRGHMR